MDRAIEELEDEIVFHRTRYFSIRVPIRFESDDLEMAYKEYHRQKRDLWVVVLVMFTFGNVMQVLSNWEDGVRIVRGNGEPWNYVLTCSNIFFILVSVASLACHRVLDTFFTERRRLLFLMIAVTRFAVCTRPVVMEIYGVDWPYVGTNKFQPMTTFVAMISMLGCSTSCQSWCLQCKHSWIMCAYAFVVVIVHGFALPLSREAWQQCCFLIVCVAIQIIVGFAGHMNTEIVERRNFLHLRSSKEALVAERVMRFQAERRAEEAIYVEKDTTKDAPVDDARQPADVASRMPSEIASRLSSLVFRGLHRASPDDEEAIPILMQELKHLGEKEHWLIQPRDLALQTDRILGIGSFGSVVAGTWMSGDVAVKVPKSRGIDDNHPLALEIRHLRKLRHPCIVSFLGTCIVDDSELLLVEELIVGDNLKVFVLKLGSFACQYARFQESMLLDVSAALYYLHSQRPVIVHGDLKPENIIVDRHMVSKLTDFGLARRSATRDKMPRGTGLWRECRLREDTRGIEVHEHVDIWALGGIAFFVCAGVGPWEGNTIGGTSSLEAFGAKVFELWRGDVDEEDTDPIREKKNVFLVDSEKLSHLSSLCYKCMSADPCERPTARDVQQEVLSWRDTRGTRCKDPLMNQEHAQHSTCNSPLSDESMLNEQITAVRIIASERVPDATHQVELPADVLNGVKGVLRQQYACLQRLLQSDVHDHQSLYIMQALLSSAFQESTFSVAAISL